MDELVEIMKCRKQLCQWVLPIFYKVNPSDVRKQSGSFGEAFVKYEDQKVDKNQMSSWRAALAEAGELSGWDLDDTDGYEGEFIKKIVEELVSVLNHTYLHVATHLVGIDTRTEYMNSLLSVENSDVRMVSICGMGGIGKTTIAKAVFNYFFHSFECKSFLANVRENSKHHKTQICLQKQLLFDILKTEVREVGSVDRGIEVIKNRLCNKKVLLVLDDVDQLDQLIAFSCESDSARRDCFGLGSRIIITTRNEHLLERIEVNDNYMIDELNGNESLELFSWHAFERCNPAEGYAQLSKDVVSYSKGLPLALEVLGSFLREFKSIAEWENALEKLKKIPHCKIQEQLRISFDALDNYQKKIFLDIACFFTGRDKDYVTKILDGCGFFATSSISILNRRCLITINEANKLIMHDLLRDMGREIVCQESVDDPGQRSRLWHCEDVLDVLTNCTGTHQIEGLALNMEGPKRVGFRAEAFARMHNVRLLQLNYVSITRGYEHLSKKLRWLCWHGFPLKFIPKNFYQEKLVAIDMQYSNLRQVWKYNKVLKNLKILDLSHSHLLTRITTDFLTLPSLEKLILEDCRGLKTIDESIGSLDKLVLLNLKDCSNLRNLPRGICMLRALEILVLSGCLKFDKFPEEMGEIKSLTVLLADKTALREIPVSIVHLKNLQYLSLCGCKGSPSKSLLSLFSSLVSPKKFPDSTSLLPNSLFGLTSLTKLSLQDCYLSDGAIPKDIGSLSSLKLLNLAGNNFSSLPASISTLSKVEVLLLNQCTELQSLPELPTSLTFFSALNSSLQRLPDLSNFSHAPNILLFNCSKLAEFPFTENLLQRWYGGYGGNNFDEILFPWSEIPDWFGHQSTSHALSFLVPPNMRKMKGLVLCVIYAAHDFKITETTGARSKSIVFVNNVTKCFAKTCIRVPIYPLIATPHDHLSLGYVPLKKFEVNGGDEVSVAIDPGCDAIVKKYGVIPVYIEAQKHAIMDISEEVNQFKSSSDNNNAIVVFDEGYNQAGNKGKRKRDDNDDEIVPSLAIDKGKRKCYADADDDEIGYRSHYWSYEEHNLSLYDMMVFPHQEYYRRFMWTSDLLGGGGHDDDDDEDFLDEDEEEDSDSSEPDDEYD
ncbi:disease resistance protein RPV1-like [Cornus florida]|uniref:disease resistance protein RPV1-like n=1 Tax=Cornus florida TaxID=4283 RepID=UPI0028A02F67|nr:disease resistance protein RPV1-like [Cornus florida]